MNTYTIEEVERHNKIEDCWIIIDGKVFDVTEFAIIHPGGKQLIYSVGGTDATEYFHELHREEILLEVANEYMIGELI